MNQLPYLSGDARATFDAWAESVLARHVPPLTFSEVRRGVQAVAAVAEFASAAGEGARKATLGAGKRAALATYFAQIDFLRAHHAAAVLGLCESARPARIVDLACGTGAFGSALALAVGKPPIVGVDRSGWALGEAQLTWAAFDLEGRGRRDALAPAIRTTGPADLVILGAPSLAFEDDDPRAVVSALVRAARRGTRILLAAPRGGAPPWWDAWRAALAPCGIREESIRVALTRPRFVREMDKAAKLDHQLIGATILISASELTESAR